jgi:GTPase SAR1 family protein
MRIISRRWVRFVYVCVLLVLICGICAPGVNFMEKTISVRRTTITFSIWDLGGQREFVNMLPLVCNDAVAILFMFDLSRKSTLNSVKEWYRQARGFNKVHFFLM